MSPRCVSGLLCALAALALGPAACGSGPSEGPEPSSGPLVVYAKSGGLSGVFEGLQIERGGAARVTIGTGGTPREFRLDDDELGELEAALAEADLEAIEAPVDTGCGDCFEYSIEHDGKRYSYDEISDPPESVTALVAELDRLVGEHSPPESAAARAGA